MPIPSKPSAVILAQSANELPTFDLRLPSDVTDRFPKLGETQLRLIAYFDQVKKVLTRLIDEQNRSRLATQATLDSVVAAQDTLRTQLAALAAIEPEVAATVDLSPVTTALAAHIAATSAHGVTGKVVGTTDVQPLDGKTIGFVGPQHARFKSAMEFGSVRPGETVTVPSGYNYVVVGTFAVYGILRIEGQMVVL